jgi:membrane protein
MSLRDRFALPREVWRKFAGDNGFLLAAAVSFYGFLSLFPLLLLAVGILGYFLGSPQHAEAILTRSVGKLIVGAQALSIIREIVHGRNAATGIGLVILLWSGTSAIVVLEQAMNLAWATTTRRAYIKRRAMALLTLLVIAVLGVLSFGISALISIAASTSAPYLSWLSEITPALKYPIPALASIGLFTMIYKLLPNTRVSWKTALVGGVFAGVMWEVAKHVFAFYIVHWPGHNRVYGSLASVILLMLWLDYSAVIAILGAEFASLWSRKHEGTSE